MASPELQELIREAGLSVELQFDGLCRRLTHDNLDLPVRQKPT